MENKSSTLFSQSIEVAIDSRQKNNDVNPSDKLGFEKVLDKIFAGIRLRLLAMYVDLMLLALPITFLLWYAGESLSVTIFIQRLFLLLIIWILVFIFINLLHDIFFTHYFGGTLGKLLTGLKVIDEHGSKLTVKRSFFRHTVGYQFSGILFGLGFLSIIKDPQKQAWHDKAVGSKVIVAKRNWPFALLILLSLIILNMYILFSAINTAFSGPLPEEFKTYMKSFETKQEKQPVSNWQTYRNDEFGFEIKYPEGWTTLEHSTQSVEFHHPDNSSYISLVVFENIGGSGDESVRGITFCGAYPDQCTREKLSIGGVQTAIEWRLHDASVQFGIPGKSYTIGISFNSNFEKTSSEEMQLFRQILSTFRFTPL